MKLPQLLSGTNIDLENRKRALQRREMGQVYRKNAQYQAPKNPLLEALENLLSGKTERDIHISGKEKRETDDLLVPHSVRENEHFEQVEENTINTLYSSLQEVPRADNERPEMWKGQAGEMKDKVLEAGRKSADFAENEKVKIPERFTGSFTEHNILQGTLLTGRQIESWTAHHLFQLASTNYLQHIAMVKNDYRSLDEPSFSKIA